MVTKKYGLLVASNIFLPSCKNNNNNNGNNKGENTFDQVAHSIIH